MQHTSTHKYLSPTRRSILVVVLLLSIGLVTANFFFDLRALAGTFINVTLFTNADLDSGLVGHWTFDGGTASLATDRGSGGNNGTVNGALANTGRIGQALVFDGTDDYVNVGNIGSGIKTIAFWVKWENATARRIIAIDGTADIRVNTSAEIVANSFPASTIYVDGSSASPTITDDWHHVVVTDTTGVNGSAFEIGREVSSYFGGRIDDVRAYDRVLSQDEITRLYQLGATTHIGVTVDSNPELKIGLMGHWTLDGKNMDFSLSTEEIRDVSGQGNHGDFTATTSSGSPATPTIEGSATYQTTSSPSSHSVTLPSGIASGELLVMIFGYGSGTGGMDNVAATGWTKLDEQNRGNALGGAVLYRIADGTEGSTVTVTGDGGDQGAAITVRISGHDSGSNPPEIVGTAITSGSGSANPPSLTPSGGSKEYLWLAPATVDAGQTISSYPSSYSSTQSIIASGQVTAAMAARLLTASSEDPGAYSHATDDSTAFTVAVYPQEAETIATTTYVTSGRIGQALEFDGATTELQVAGGDASIYDFDNSNFTLSAWVKSTLSTTGYIVSAGNGDLYNMQLEDDGDVTFQFITGPEVGDTNNITASGSYNDGDWHHIVAVRDGARTGRVYIDGVLAVEDTDNSGTNTAINIATDLFIGREAVNADYFEGTIDDVRVYNRALSSDEVTRLHGLGATTHVNTTITTNPQLESSLIGHWTLDGPDVDIANNQVTDRSTQGSHGATSGMDTATTTKPGRIGQALDFDGTDDFVAIPGGDGSIYDPGGSNFSVAAWIKSTLTTTGFAVAADGITNELYNLQLQSDGDIAFIYSTGDVQTMTATGNYNDGNWHHVVGVRDGTRTGKLYVNGVVAAEDTDNSGSWGGIEITSDLYIGADPEGGDHFDGIVDDVRYYNRALSADEVRRMYHLGN